MLSDQATECTVTMHRSAGLALQAVIFDVDGTLADTERDGHRVSFNMTFKEFGFTVDNVVATVKRVI